MQKCAKEIHEEAHLQDKPRPSTDVGGAQAHPGIDHAKAVASRPHQGAGVLGVWPHHCQCRLGLVSSSSCMLPCYVGFGWFPNLLRLNQPGFTILEEEVLTFQNTTFGATHLTSLLVLS